MSYKGPKPKYYKKSYNIESISSYKDVPGWCNDAEVIFKMMVDRAEDGAHFVEIGTLLGQSASMMGTYINESNKDISFDSIDLFWTIEPHIRAGVESGYHPPSFLKYIEDCYKEYNYEKYQGIIDIIQHPFHRLNCVDKINLITCDEQYAHRLYNDETLQFVWIDGDHNEGVVFRDLENFWPKIKMGGFIGGDDLEEVREDVEKFVGMYNIKDIHQTYTPNGFLLHKHNHITEPKNLTSLI